MTRSYLPRPTWTLLAFLFGLAAFGEPTGKSSSYYAVPIYRSQVSEVQLTFSATDQTQRPVADLKATDFAVVDKDFIVRNFRSFRRAEYTRLDMAILLDASGSVSPRFQQEIHEVLEVAAQTSGLAEEGLSVLSFQGMRPTMICKNDCNGPQTDSSLAKISSSGPTPLYDSLSEAAALLREAGDPHSRKVVILFSDGQDTISRNSADDAIEDLFNSEVQVYTVNLSPIANPSGTAFLEKLSSLTGGHAFRLQDGATAVVDSVLQDFRSSYQVTYKLPYPSSGFHAIRILPTHNLNLNFRCRAGYFDSADSH